MGTHTEGPWHAIESHKWRDWSPVHSQPSTVCHIGDWTIVTSGPSYEFHGNDEDDARLIAAAPEMLQVLNACRIAIKNRDQDGREMKLLDAIKIVIAKAEGSAQKLDMQTTAKPE